MIYCKNSYSLIFNLFFINHKQTKDGITIRAVIIKKVAQSPFNQSTRAPDDEANVVLPAVPIEANKAYWVAVYVLSTNNEIKATNATVAKAAVKSSTITAIANNNSDFPTQASNANIKFVDVSSSLESSPGEKNIKKINNFLNLADKL